MGGWGGSFINRLELISKDFPLLLATGELKKKQVLHSFSDLHINAIVFKRPLQHSWQVDNYSLLPQGECSEWNMALAVAAAVSH